MKLHGVVDLYIQGEQIRRDPNLWDKVKSTFGARPDLTTGKMRASIEATALVDGIRAALRRLGITNAVSLVIDEQVLFQDRDGKEDDLGDLLLAFHDASSVFGQEFQLLRLAVEHREVGLHMILEVVALVEHPEDSAAARIVVSGRIMDLEPRSGEDADAYRARVEPLTKDGSRLEAHRLQFESFVARVSQIVAASLPEARVEQREAEARIEKPEREGKGRKRALPAPTDRRYDPHEAYYPSPMSGMLSMMMWTSVFSMAMRPNVMVMDQSGQNLGAAADVPADVAADPLSASAGDFGDSGAGDMSELGGDMGGSDFGGFDGGGFGDW